MRSERFNQKNNTTVSRAVQEEEEVVVESDDAAVVRAVQEDLERAAKEGEDYDQLFVNLAINANNKNPGKVAVAELNDDQYQGLPRALQEFKIGSKRQITIPLRPGQNHFSALLVSRQRDGSFKATCFDPLGADNAFPIPDIVLGNLRQALKINSNNIAYTSNAIQHCDGRVITNNHCGPFTGFIAAEIANDNIRITNNKLEIKIGRNWQVIPDLNEEESRLLGNKIRQRDYQLFSGDIVNIDPLEQLKEIVIGRNQSAALTTQARKDPLNFKAPPNQSNPKSKVSLWKRFINRLREIGKGIIKLFKEEKEPPFIGSYIKKSQSRHEAVDKKYSFAEFRDATRDLQPDKSEIVRRLKEEFKIRKFFNSLARSDNPGSFAQSQEDEKSSLMHSALGRDLTPSSIPPFLIEHNPSSNTMTVTTWGAVKGEGLREFTFKGKEIDQFIQKVEEAKIAGRYSIRDIAVKFEEERAKEDPVAKKSNMKKSEGPAIEENAKKERGVRFADRDEVREFKKEAMPFAARVTKSKFRENGLNERSSDENANQTTTGTNSSIDISRLAAIPGYRRRTTQSNSPQGVRTR